MLPSGSHLLVVRSQGRSCTRSAALWYCCGATILMLIYVFWDVKKICTSHDVDRQGATTSSLSPRMKIHIPGGFEVKGKCNFQLIKEQNEKVDLGVFVKHGLHSTRNLIPKNCHLESHILTLRLRESFTPKQLGGYPLWTVSFPLVGSNHLYYYN